MSEEMVFMIGGEAIKTAIFLAGPMLVAAMTVGITVSVFQAITQINEATLSFIPKMIAVVIVLIVMSPWMLKVVKGFATMVLGNVGDWIR